MGFNTNSPNFPGKHVKVKWSRESIAMVIYENTDKLDIFREDKIRELGDCWDSGKFNDVWLVCSVLLFEKIQD